MTIEKKIAFNVGIWLAVLVTEVAVDYLWDEAPIDSQDVRVQ